jgi:hypothetical protein
MGGGACWSAETCDPESGPYQRSLADVPEPSKWQGIFELDDPENPFAGWSMVFVPYCTADVHLGDRTTEYALPARDGKPASRVTIHHNGWRNDHLAGVGVRPPSRSPAIFVVGTSAGSLPLADRGGGRGSAPRRADRAAR